MKQEPMEAIIIKFKVCRKKKKGRRLNKKVEQEENLKKGYKKNRRERRDAEKHNAPKEEERDGKEHCSKSRDGRINRPDKGLPSCSCPCLSYGTSPSLVEHHHCYHRCHGPRMRHRICGSSVAPLVDDVEVWPGQRTRFR